MRKLIAAINMTLDGFCDHTAMIADEEIHQHYNELLSNAGTLLYGRITYQLMESYWPSVVKNPTGNKPMDEFAVLIDNISKIVFSRTLKNVDWKNTKLKKEVIKEEVLELKQQAGKNILVGSPSLIVALTQLDLIDEYQLGVQPIVLGSGLPLFKNIKDRINLKLLKTKTFGCGAVTLYYEPTKKAGSSISSTSARTSSSDQGERPARSMTCFVTPRSASAPTLWASECSSKASSPGQRRLRFTHRYTFLPTRSANPGSGRAGRRSTSSTTARRVPLSRLGSLRAVAIFASRAART